MHRTFKKLMKHSKLFRYAFLICIIVLIAAFIYQKNHYVSPKDIAAVEEAKGCIVTMGLAKTLPECASANEAEMAAENILRLSWDEKQKGWASMVLDDFTGANRYLDNAFLLDQNDTGVWKDLIFTYMNLQEYNGVTSLCSRMLKIDANDTFCLNALGIAYYNIDENEKALEKGKKAYEIDPSVCTEFNLGLYHGGIGEIEKTKETTDKLIEGNKTKLLKCWSPVKVDIPDDKIDNYNICFMNKQRQESVCRSFAEEGWTTRSIETGEIVPELPGPVYSM